MSIRIFILSIFLLGAPAAASAQASVYSTSPAPRSNGIDDLGTTRTHESLPPSGASSTILPGSPGTAGTSGTGAVGEGPTGTMASPGH